MIFIAWCFFGILQLVITLYLALGFKKYAQKRNTFKPGFSIIIAAHNEEENLKKLIPAIITQKYPDLEIIIALDRSTDDSSAYLKTYGEQVKVIEIDEVPDEWNPKKFALNRAISLSTNDWLVFTDADCLPASDEWLASVAGSIHSTTEIVLGVSPYQNGSSVLSNFVQFEGFMTAFTYISRALRNRAYMGVGRNMAMKRSLFEEVGGYNDVKGIKGGDDDLLIQKSANSSNTSTSLGEKSLVWTYPKKSWKDYFNQKNRHLSVGSKYKWTDQLFLSFFHTSHLLFILLISLNASHAFFWPMLLFYLFIKLVSYRFAASKIGMRINYMWLPLVDMLYAMLIPIIALWSKLVKDIPWKN